MSYIVSYEQFIEQYPKDSLKPLGEGSYGTVYATKDESMAIKVGRIDSVLEDIDIMAQFIHPNIIRMKSLAFDAPELDALIAMPMGISVSDYVATIGLDDDIIHSPKFKRIVFELVCGLRAMEDVGIVHGDIKPDNIVMVRGTDTLYHPIYIDFGLAKYTTPVCINGACDQMYYSYGFRYTPGYREPEYLPNRYNSYKGDIYALAKSIESILISDDYKASLPMITDNDDLNDLLEKMLSERAKRPTAETLMKHPYFDDVRQFCSRGVRIILPIPSKDGLSDVEDLWYDTIYAILQWAIPMSWSMRALIMAIHNMHRSLPALSLSSWPVGVRDKLYLLALSNLALIGQLLMNDNFLHDEEDIGDDAQMITYIGSRYRSIGDREFKSQDVIEAIFICLTVLGGPIIASTYWDEAKSGKVLIPMLEATISWSYRGPKDDDWSRRMGYQLGQQPISPMTKNVTTQLLSIWMNSIAPYARYPRLKAVRTGVGGKDLKRMINAPSKISLTSIPISMLKETDAKLLIPIPVEKYRDMVLEEEFDLVNYLGYVYALQDQMAIDADLSNYILHTLMNVEIEYRPWVALYDIIFNPRKLTLWGEDLYDIDINSYTASYAEILQALGRG